MITQFTGQTAVENQFVRVTGRDADAAAVLARAKQANDLPIKFAAIGDPNAADYANIDLTLTTSGCDNYIGDDHIGDVDPRLGFGGWTPAQRGRFLHWLCEVDDIACPAFQALYLANLEIRLFESAAWRDEVQTELLRLHDAPAWRDHAELARVTGLALWLRQDGDGLAAWLAQCTPPPTWFGIALGWQALLETPMRAEQMAALLQTWQPASRPAAPELIPPDLIALHLDTLANTLGQEPLAYALAELDPAALQPRPWRGVHRDVRLLFPQPNIAKVLKSLLMEIQPLAVAANRPTSAVIDETSDSDAPLPQNNENGYANWHLILEFSQSRSEYFQLALELAARNETFAQIMDEDRRLVYRVMFQKGRMRNFWRLWEYVKGWSSTRVYIQGEEVETWKVYPHSQFMR